MIAGSSTAENFNNRWFDETFGVTSIKAIKSSAVTAQLDYYLKEAFDSNDIKNVFYSLDIFSLSGDPYLDFPDESMPVYLYDKNPFNDVKYLFNKDVIFEDIPYMIAATFLDDYDEGTSYNWAQYNKVFGKEAALSHYVRPKETADEISAEEYVPLVDGNVDILEEMVKTHPDTKFYFFYPPYSILWWDSMIRSGQLEQSMYAAEASMKRLLPYENVKMYYFQNEEDIALTLSLNMDQVHFTPETNHWMVEEMWKDNYRLNVDNYKEELDKMRIIAEKIRADYEGMVEAAD